ncbi:MAG: DNA translocase FtsK 4TM domain-containing protein [Thermodesulfobacteriota bacterium]
MALAVARNKTSAKELRSGGGHSPSVAVECRGLVFVALGIFFLLCLLSYDPRDPSFNTATERQGISNLCGLVGAHVADLLVQAAGIAALLFPLALIFVSLRGIFHPGRAGWWSEAASLLGLTAALATMLERFSVGQFLHFNLEHPGGTVGAFLHNLIYALLGSGGEILLCATLMLVCLLRMSAVSFRDVAIVAARGANLAKDLIVASRERMRSQRDAVQSLNDSKTIFPEPVVPVPPKARRRESVVVEPPDEIEFEYEAPYIDGTLAGSWERLSCLPQENWDEDYVGPLAPVERPADPEPRDVPEPSPAVDELELAVEAYLKEQAVVAAIDDCPEEVPIAPVASARTNRRKIHVARRVDEDVPRGRVRKREKSAKDEYVLPSPELLDAPPRANRAVDQRLLKRNAEILEQKLMELGVRCDVVAIHPGPVITMYEVNLAAGVPLRKVLNTCDDLAMALKSGSTRVVAPIPGKDTVGIEVPNLYREIVYLREIVESPTFVESTDPLKMALGKGIDGEPVATSLARMPHLLIAGATGTGKSVGLNALICSLIMWCHPDDLKLLLVDPKKLELSYYQDIPHLIHPVVTEPEKVPAVLSWAIREMERRYDLLSAAGSKDIEGYNQKVRSGDAPGGPEGQPAEKLPYIVIIVDELAELMMVAAKDIEISIARLAQMARAAGIHLVLATQRPSVDVITGIIKANFPARMSYQVSARADSRTILDTVGAEHLLGRGDMLFLPPGAAKLIRLHGAYISENEISRIVDHIKAQRSPSYLQEISKHVEGEGSKAAGSDLIDDEKYDEAVELVSRLGHASISLIQRHMRIGYNRAARIIEAMEVEGLIGPSDGTSRPREVLARSLHHIPDRPGL